MPERDASSDIARQLFMRTFSAGVPLGSAASQLSRVMRDEAFRAGTELYQRGGASDRLYFLAEGRVRLALPGTTPWTFEEGSALGLLDLLQDRPHAGTATALTYVRALSLDAEDYFDVLEDNFEFTRNSIVNMAASLHALRLSLPPSGGFSASDAAPRSRRSAAAVGVLPARPLNLVERTIALRDVPALRASGIQALTSMAGLVEERRLAAGEALFALGEPASAIAFVTSGRVAIERESPSISASFGAGSMVGGYASLGLPTHPFTATALEASAALLLDKEDLFDLLELHFELARSIIANLAAERERALLLMASSRAATAGAEGDGRPPWGDEAPVI